MRLPTASLCVAVAVCAALVGIGGCSWRRAPAADSASGTAPIEQPAAAPSRQETLEAVAAVRAFAERYQPASTESRFIPGPPDLDQSTTAAIDTLEASASSEHEPYIVLVLLRLYRFQEETLHQQYDMCDFNHPEAFEPRIVAEFCRLAPICDHYPGLLGPSAAFDWVRQTGLFWIILRSRRRSLA